MREIVESRWFQIVNLLLALVSGAIWYVWPQAGAWVLLLALLPWVVRVAAGYFPFRRTVFDLPLALFLLTAGLGVWTSFQRDVALAKFWVIIAAVLLYYAVSSLSVGNAWLLTVLIGILGVSVGSYFMLTHDWGAQPADLGVLNQVAQKWILVRPDLNLTAIDQNRAGGILALCLPFTIALTLQVSREKKRILALGAFGISILIIVFLLMTSSRGAWLASIIAFGLWMLWEVSPWMARSAQKSRAAVFILLLLVIIAIPVLFVVLGTQEGFSGFIERIPGRATFGSRLSLYEDTLHLIDDFLILGGGLGSFPGLYSQYIKLLPYFYFGYSHNLYLDVALEQGIFGIFSFAFVFLGSVWLVINQFRHSRSSENTYLLNWAILAGLVVVLLHGLVDDPFYGEYGTPLLFLLSGFSVASTRWGQSQEFSRTTGLLRQDLQSPLLSGKRVVLVGGSLVVLVLAFFFGSQRPVLAELFANIGAVQMARTELASWPTRKWIEDTDVSTLQTSKVWFDRSLALDPENKTSHYHLGLIAMRAQDFENSESHLETAHASDLDHPGLLKSLGYCYLWSGELASGAHLLKEVPEANHELLVYIGWWRKLGKLDLSNRAISATLLLRMINVIEQESNSQVSR